MGPEDLDLGAQVAPAAAVQVHLCPVVAVVLHVALARPEGAAAVSQTLPCHPECPQAQVALQSEGHPNPAAVGASVHHARPVAVVAGLLPPGAWCWAVAVDAGPQSAIPDCLIATWPAFLPLSFGAASSSWASFFSTLSFLCAESFLEMLLSAWGAWDHPAVSNARVTRHA